MPGYFGLDRAAGLAAGGAASLGASGFDAGFFSPAAEELIGRERRRERYAGWRERPNRGSWVAEELKSSASEMRFPGRIKGKERRKSDIRRRTADDGRLT